MSSFVTTHPMAALMRARQSRDPRFDGLFFVGVVTTGVYCRPICPARTAAEPNVVYVETALEAAQQGFRPCLRCKPDCAPASSAWLGENPLLTEALTRVQEGALSYLSVGDLASELGVTDRYLRKLFVQHIGVPPNHFATYNACLFAKRLLQQSSLPIAEIAYACGFNSVRRFNDAIPQHLGLTPSQLRRKTGTKGISEGLQVRLSYRPPFAVDALFDFFNARALNGVEVASEHAYSRTVRLPLAGRLPSAQPKSGEARTTTGWIKVTADTKKACFVVAVHLNNTGQLLQLTHRLKRMLDVDCPIDAVQTHLLTNVPSEISLVEGLRVPGVFDVFETGVRAILGQQVTVVQARRLTIQLVAQLGEKIETDIEGLDRLFPTPEAIAASDLEFLKMPQSRKDTLQRLAVHFLTSADPLQVELWLEIKGIGPWTVNYVRLRALKDPDVWLAGDAGLNNALKKVSQPFVNARLSPWRSYMTFQLWHQNSPYKKLERV